MTAPVRIQLARNAAARSALTIVGCFEDVELETGNLTNPIASALARAAGRAAWSGRAAQRSEAEVRGRTPGTVVLHGLGKSEAFDRGKLCRWVRRVAVETRSHGVASAQVVLPDHSTAAGFDRAESLLREFMQSDYRFDEFRRQGDQTRIQSFSLVPPGNELATYRRAAKVAKATAGGVRLARDLANTPPNVATPAWMATQARKLAASHGMKISVLGPKEMRARGMGGILAVGSGAANTPRLIRLEYGNGKKTVSLVGKGVTFDTGGISIKPAAAMDEMKYDKSGACTVLGIARAVAELDLPVKLRVYVALAENMPDGKAYRPGDIITCYNKKTVEIRNTDAEGRMILADALAWAAREKPHFMLDYATLTGACVVALGNHGAGLFSPSDDLASALLEAAQSSDEYLWRLPLWPQFLADMKGVHADLKNSGSRWGGASTAAAFLSEFVAGARNWAHLDIAGPAYVGNAHAARAGATGYGVAFTIHWLRSLKR
jgi:leucyl aminopeptidase